MIKVNGIELVDKTHADAVATFREVGDSCVLMIDSDAESRFLGVSLVSIETHFILFNKAFNK